MRRRLASTTALLGILVLSLSCSDSTEPGPVAEIEISGPDEVLVGREAPLTARVIGNNGEELTDQVVEWTSENSSIASVSAEGVVSAHAAGTATISASARGATASHRIRVLAAIDVGMDTLSMSALNDTVHLVGMVGSGRQLLQITVSSETRWTPDRPVITISGQNVISNGAGNATLSLTTNSGAVGSLEVVVTPTHPYLSSISSAAPVNEEVPLLLSGYGLEALKDTDILLDGITPTLSVVDSSGLALTIPPISASECRGRRGEIQISPMKADNLLPSPYFSRERHGERIIDTWDPVRLTTQETECLKLGPGHYVLAYFDAQFVDKLEALPYTRPTGGYNTTIRDISNGPAAGASAAPAPAPVASYNALNMPDPGRRYHEMRELQAAELGPEFGSDCHWLPHLHGCATEPWVVGDTVTMVDYGFNANRHDTVSMRIVEIINDYHAIAVLDSAQIPPDMLPAIVDHYEAFEAQHAPWLEELFGGRPGAPNGQMLSIFFFDVTGVHMGRAWLHFIEYRLPTYMWTQPEALYTLIVHEMAHNYSNRRKGIEVLKRGEGARYPRNEIGFSEGLADHIGYRALAERYGTGFNRNELPLSRMLMLFGNGYALEYGYEHTANHLFYLTDRLAEATGWEWEAAHDTISIGALYGRYGCTYGPWIGVGDQWSGGELIGCDQYDALYDKLRRYIDPNWDPSEAALKFLLAQILDDLSDIPELNNPHVYRPWKDFKSKTRTGYGGTMHAYSDTTITSMVSKGALNAFLLEDEEGGAYNLTSESNKLEMMLVRIPEPLDSYK